MTRDQLNELRVMQAKARAGTLGAEERARYLEACTQLERALIRAQKLLAPAKARPRCAFRAAVGCDLELTLGSDTFRTRASDFSTGGFSVVLDRQVSTGERASFALRFGRLDEPVRGTAVCRGTRIFGLHWRTSFQLEAPSNELLSRLELEVVEAELDLLWPSAHLDP
jgi:hypothetical protein